MPDSSLEGPPSPNCPLTRRGLGTAPPPRHPDCSLICQKGLVNFKVSRKCKAHPLSPVSFPCLPPATHVCSPRLMTPGTWLDPFSSFFFLLNPVCWHLLQVSIFPQATHTHMLIGSSHAAVLGLLYPFTPASPPLHTQLFLPELSRWCTCCGHPHNTTHSISTHILREALLGLTCSLSSLPWLPLADDSTQSSLLFEGGDMLAFSIRV